MVQPLSSASAPAKDEGSRCALIEELLYADLERISVLYHEPAEKRNIPPQAAFELTNIGLTERSESGSWRRNAISDEYLHVLRRFINFSFHGTVPDDLKALFSASAA